MNKNEIIRTYIKEALAGGATREEVEKVLLESGWTKEKIDEAFLSLDLGFSSQQTDVFQQSQTFRGQYQGDLNQYGGYGSQVPQSQQNYSQRTGIFAGFWIRLLAQIIDTIIISVGFGFLFGLFYGLINNERIVDSFLILILTRVISMIAVLLYYSLMESSQYQGTIGKIICGLRVTDLNGQRISLGKAVVRYIGHWVCGLTLGIGYLIIAFDEKKQGLHDKIAGTLVLK